MATTVKLDYERAKSLAKDERETVIYQNAGNRNVWAVYSDDPTMMKKLARLAKSAKQHGFGAEFEFEGRQILIRKIPKKRSLTEKNNLRNSGPIETTEETSDE